MGYAMTTRWGGADPAKLQMIGFDMGGTSTGALAPALLACSRICLAVSPSMPSATFSGCFPSFCGMAAVDANIAVQPRGLVFSCAVPTSAACSKALQFLPPCSPQPSFSFPLPTAACRCLPLRRQL